MKYPFHAAAPPFDAQAINETIQRALASAGLDTSSGPMRGVTETIRRALAAGRPVDPAGTFADGSVIDVPARFVSDDEENSRAPYSAPVAGTAQGAPGSFETFRASNDTGTLAYKVYVPVTAASSDTPLPMMVMLHGCTQSADDFAAGTQMNRLADAHGFLVVYPEQAAQANASKCWNWFKPQDQLRGAGEPLMIASIVREVAQEHRADPGRIFVAGLSAGAAMAVVLGETYPELFSGVGAHSGLPYASAHDIPSALAAMKGGRNHLPERRKPAAGPRGAPRRKAVKAVPIIVFHGDRDHTVQQKNGGQIVQQALEAHSAQAGQAALHASTQTGVTPGGRRFNCTAYTDDNGQARVESWTVHGAGHAWSGGHAGGSYTDGTGPDASAEMVRFFMALPRNGGA